MGFLTLIDQVDDETEFTSLVIERGKPTRNALIESLDASFRDECLNQNWFVDVRRRS